MTESFTIDSFEKTRIARSLLGGNLQDLYIATLRVEGQSLQVSQWHDENYWVVDALTTSSSSMPLWCHGPGSRVTLLRTLKEDTSVTRQLEQLRAGLDEPDQFDGFIFDTEKLRYMPLCDECGSRMTGNIHGVWECNQAPVSHRRMMYFAEDFPPDFGEEDDE